MTVIAYRKGIMACDSCWSEGDGLVSNVQNKLVRLPYGAICGTAGASDDRALLKLLRNVTDPERLPEAATLLKQEYTLIDCLLALPDKTLWRVYGNDEDEGITGGVYRVTTPFAAIGSGAPVAYGALAKGASAEEAVRIACQWNVFCRPPVHTLALDEKRNDQ